MSLKPFALRLWCGMARSAIRCGTVVAMLIVLGSSTRAATAVLNAPTVAPAPVIDKPLAPATNDTPGEQPSTQHVWVPGHWRWHEGAYVWEAGRWEIPPKAGVAWAPPQWRKDANGYTLQDGYWSETPPTPPPQIAAAPQPPQEIVVSAPPPPPQPEVIFERPTPVHVWIQGHWRWREGRHMWIPGRWEVPPRQNAIWVSARWEMRGNHYVFVEGFWRDTALVSAPPPASVVVNPSPAPQVVILAPPPPPRREVVYVRPSPRHVWIPGYWAWRGGRHVWIAGHYELPPRGYSAWREPRWERRGGNYIFFEGHWGR
jgi:hypothetical protein